MNDDTRYMLPLQPFSGAFITVEQQLQSATILELAWVLCHSSMTCSRTAPSKLDLMGCQHIGQASAMQAKTCSLQWVGLCSNSCL